MPNSGDNYLIPNIFYDTNSSIFHNMFHFIYQMHEQVLCFSIFNKFILFLNSSYKNQHALLIWHNIPLKFCIRIHYKFRINLWEKTNSILSINSFCFLTILALALDHILCHTLNEAIFSLLKIRIDSYYAKPI